MAQLDTYDLLQFLRDRKEQFYVEYKVVKIGLFGSFASGEQTEQSDIDVLIEFEPNTSDLMEKKASIRSIIAGQFNREVDLCREKFIKPYFRNQILQSVIYV